MDAETVDIVELGAEARKHRAPLFVSVAAIEPFHPSSYRKPICCDCQLIRMDSFSDFTNAFLSNLVIPDEQASESVPALRHPPIQMTDSAMPIPKVCISSMTLYFIKLIIFFKVRPSRIDSSNFNIPSSS